MAMLVLERVSELFWAKVEIHGDSECWEWTASKDKDGYGRFPTGYKFNKEGRAHRFSWWLHRGPASHFEVDHKCRNRACVRPSHLQLVPKGWNAQQGADASKERRLSSSVCPEGHEYTQANTRVNTKGHRMCVQCYRVSRRMARLAKIQSRAASDSVASPR